MKLTNAQLRQRLQNVERMAELRRSRTHCVHGHSLEDAYKYKSKKGWNRRICRECHRLNDLKRSARRSMEKKLLFDQSFSNGNGTGADTSGTFSNGTGGNMSGKIVKPGDVQQAPQRVGAKQAQDTQIVGAKTAGTPKIMDRTSPAEPVQAEIFVHSREVLEGKQQIRQRKPKPGDPEIRLRETSSKSFDKAKRNED